MGQQHRIDSVNVIPIRLIRTLLDSHSNPRVHQDAFVVYIDER